MNRWAAMLADLPALGQRLIARHHRISVHRCAAPERLARLRRALCRTATVRATYARLDPATQATLDDLAHRPYGIAPADLTARYGPVRPWNHMATDCQPRTISERLVLMGWLLPRPAAPQHPPRYLVPFELRQRLPHRLWVPTFGPAATPPVPPAVRAAQVVLLAAAQQPVPLRADDTLRVGAVRMLAPRLIGCGDERAIPDLLRLVVPLLGDLGLLAGHAGTATLAPAGERFLALTPLQQGERLRQAWLGMRRPDAWLVSLVRDRRGLDGLALRRRLVTWVQALPVGQLLDPATLYPALAATFGPLANAATHGYRHVDRVPWQPARALTVWNAALTGPLTWLGYVAWTNRNGQHYCFRAHASASAAEPTLDERLGSVNPTAAAPLPPSLHAPANDPPDAGDVSPEAPVAWHYGAPGVVTVPLASGGHDLVRLAPFSTWHATDTTATHYRVSAASLARAITRGHSDTALWAQLQRRAGPPPVGWDHGLRQRSGIRVRYGAIIEADTPALLGRAMGAGSVRRYLGQRITADVAITHADQVAGLVRALERQGIAATVVHAPPTPPPQGLTTADCVALVVACAAYRLQPPPGGLPPDPRLEQQLHAALPPGLRVATDQAIAALTPPPPTPAPPPAFTSAAVPIVPAAPPERPTDPAVLTCLERALQRRARIGIAYTDSGGQCSERQVQPIALVERCGRWYLRAACLRAQAERTFRVDRIAAVQMPPHRPTR